MVFLANWQGALPPSAMSSRTQFEMLIGIDVGSIHQGFFGDHAKTFAVGSIDSNKEKLIDVTKECLMKGISQANPGNRIGDIGYAIQTYAESFGFGVVKD